MSSGAASIEGARRARTGIIGRDNDRLGLWSSGGRRLRLGCGRAHVCRGTAGLPGFAATGCAGLLLPATEGARQLPEGVAFARDGAGIADFLRAQGIAVPEGEGPAQAMAPEDLTRRARDMTVLVTCWN